MRLVLMISLFSVLAAAVEIPFSFERNQGQARPSARYFARGRGYSLMLEERAAVLTVPGERQALRLSFAGSLAPKSIEPQQPLRQQSNYFIGDQASRWTRNVIHYGSLKYREIYPGVDLVYHSAANELEYDFLLEPHADPRRIELEFGGTRQVVVDSNGALLLQVGQQTITQKAPVAFQEIDGQRRLIPARYQQRSGGRIGFELGDYDCSHPLVIDPVLVYSTYLGGNRADFITGMAVDREGAVYVVGQTGSIDFPVKGTNLTPYQGAVPYGFIAKFKPGGEELVYSTFIGGSSNTTANAIAVDDDGNAYVTGRTGARNFPLVDAVQSQQPGLNIGFVLKLNPAGDKLLFSTYHGGERNDSFNAIAIDAARNIYVTGQTTSTTFPLVNAWQAQMGGASQDAFVAKYAAPGYRLVYSSYMGGAGTEEGHGIAVDATGAAYVTGATRSPNFATPGVFQTRYGSTEDGFVARIQPTGGLAWFSYLGGNGDDIARAIALDPTGAIWVAGSSVNQNFPVTQNAIQKTLSGNSDAFFARISNDGSSLLYATYFGGSSRTGSTYNEAAQALAIDPQGKIWVAGVTRAADFPAVRAMQPFGGGETDGFVLQYNPETNAIEFSSHWGGASNEEVNSMAVDAAGAVYLGGETFSNNFPLKAAFRSTFGPSSDGFVSKLCDPRLVVEPGTITFLQVQGTPAPASQSLCLNACASIPYTLRLEGDFLRATPLSGNTGTTIQVSVDGRSLAIGDYEAKLIFTSPDAANSPLEVPVRWRVNPPGPTISASAVVNAASSRPGPVAPGELVVIYGANLGPAQLAGFAVNGSRFATEVGGTRVLFDGIAAPIVYTSSGQVSAIVPYAVAGKTSTQMQLEYRGARSAAVALTVAAASPALFTANSSGSGPGAILNQDYTLNTAANGAERGSTVILYATGEGATNPQSVDGQITADVLARPQLPVSVTIGGQQAIVDYAGAAPGLVAGVFQINARIPSTVAPGNQPVVITVGSISSPSGVTVSVR